MGDILKQAKEAKAKFKQGGNRELMDEVIKSTEAYKKGFDDYVVLWEKKVKAGEEMLKAAKALEEKSAIVRNDQKSELQAIFSLLLIVSVLIAILGGITAGVLITKAITNPDRQLVSATSQELSSSAQEMNATIEETSSTVQQIATGSASFNNFGEPFLIAGMNIIPI